MCGVETGKGFASAENVDVDDDRCSPLPGSRRWVDSDSNVSTHVAYASGGRTLVSLRNRGVTRVACEVWKKRELVFTFPEVNRDMRVGNLAGSWGPRK
jgi:hypothetical protein